MLSNWPSPPLSKGRLGVKWVYTVELRPNESDPAANEDDGYGGFALPVDQIVPTGEEELRRFGSGVGLVRLMFQEYCKPLLRFPES